MHFFDEGVSLDTPRARVAPLMIKREAASTTTPHPLVMTYLIYTCGICGEED